MSRTHAVRRNCSESSGPFFIKVRQKTSTWKDEKRQASHGRMLLVEWDVTFCVISLNAKSMIAVCVKGGDHYRKYFIGTNNWKMKICTVFVVVVMFFIKNEKDTIGWSLKSSTVTKLFTKNENRKFKRKWHLSFSFTQWQ